MANFRTFTRYTNGQTYPNRAGQDFLILRPPLKLENSPDDVYVTITADIVNRPDLISFKAYGSPDLWWAIYEYNGITDPLFNIKTGQILRIPNQDRLLTAIQKLNRV